MAIVYIWPMGSARNLKLGGTGGGKARGIRGNNFFVGPNVDPINSAVVCMEKM